MSLSVSNRNVKGRFPHAFLWRMGGEFAHKPLNLMRPLAPRLAILFNLILMLLGQSASAGGRLFYPSC